jgi:hypothetical protein
MDELDAERERSLRATASQIRDEIKTMTRDPERFTLHTAQKSYPQQAASLQAFCDEIRLGIELATAAERRCAFEILQLRGPATGPGRRQDRSPYVPHRLGRAH